MSLMPCQITGVSIDCSVICSGADQRKHQSSASLAFLMESTGQQGPVMRKMFPFDDVFVVVVVVVVSYIVCPDLSGYSLRVDERILIIYLYIIHLYLFTYLFIYLYI